jgi:hypothetical protein
VLCLRWIRAGPSQQQESNHEFSRTLQARRLHMGPLRRISKNKNSSIYVRERERERERQGERERESEYIYKNMIQRITPISASYIYIYIYHMYICMYMSMHMSIYVCLYHTSISASSKPLKRKMAPSTGLARAPEL